MTKGIWRTSAVEQPMNGQPVWVYHNLAIKDIYGALYPVGIYKAIFHWCISVHDDQPFWWEMAKTPTLTGRLYGNRLWMPRLSGETPEPPPVEKQKI